MPFQNKYLQPWEKETESLLIEVQNSLASHLNILQYLKFTHHIQLFPSSDLTLKFFLIKPDPKKIKIKKINYIPFNSTKLCNIAFISKHFPFEGLKELLQKKIITRIEKRKFMVNESCLIEVEQNEASNHNQIIHTDSYEIDLKEYLRFMNYISQYTIIIDHKYKKINFNNEFGEKLHTIGTLNLQNLKSNSLKLLEVLAVYKDTSISNLSKKCNLKKQQISSCITDMNKKHKINDFENKFIKREKNRIIVNCQISTVA